MVGVTAHKVLHQGLDSTVVTGRQGKQRDLIVSGVVQQLIDQVADGVRLTFADRPVDVTGLAKATATGATTGNLYGDPVMDSL